MAGGSPDSDVDFDYKSVATATLHAATHRITAQMCRICTLDAACDACVISLYEVVELNTLVHLRVGTRAYVCTRACVGICSHFSPMLW